MEKVNPDLVARDADGKALHCALRSRERDVAQRVSQRTSQVQEQEATITQLKSTVAKQEATAAHQQKEIEALTAGLQKVSAQIQMSRSAPQIVLNNQ